MIKKTALITGASRLQGIGRAICMQLAQQGCDIFFTYWRPYDESMPWDTPAHEPDMIQQEVLNLGVRCEKLELDLSHTEAITTLFQQVENTLGLPSILVNNATYSTNTSIDTCSAIELDKHYAVNVRAPTLLALQFIKKFPFQTGGRIINLSSGQSLGEMPNEIAYAMTKGAIETLTTTISKEIAAKGITINAVNPGPTDTGWLNEELHTVLEKRFPMKRIGMPEDAAKLIGFLCSEDAQWITGQIIHSEGGFIRSI